MCRCICSEDMIQWLMSFCICSPLIWAPSLGTQMGILASESFWMHHCVQLPVYQETSRLWVQLANGFDWSLLSKEQCLLSESFLVSFCTIFVLVVSEWALCTILPKVCVLCAAFFSNICSSRYLLVRSFQVEA